MSGFRGRSVATAVLAIMALPVLAGPASAASYAWTLTCRVGGDFPGAASASWDWLQDGQVIEGAGGTAICGESGGGDRPANANGIAASLTATAFVVGGPLKSVTREVTKSFDPTDSFQLSLHASASSTGKFCFFGSCGPVQHSSVHAAFTMTG